MKNIFRYISWSLITYDSLNSYNSPMNLLGDGVFQTKGDVQNEWVALCASGVKIIPKAYRIKAVNSAPSNTHMKSWFLHGSKKNNSEWVQLDKKEDNYDIQGNGKEKTFPLNNDKSYQCYRIMIILSHNSVIPYRLTLDDFDIEGTLILNRKVCSNAKFNSINFMFFVILINK